MDFFNNNSEMAQNHNKMDDIASDLYVNNRLFTLSLQTVTVIFTLNNTKLTKRL